MQKIINNNIEVKYNEEAWNKEAADKKFKQSVAADITTTIIWICMFILGISGIFPWYVGIAIMVASVIVGGALFAMPDKVIYKGNQKFYKAMRVLTEKNIKIVLIGNDLFLEKVCGDDTVEFSPLSSLKEKIGNFEIRSHIEAFYSGPVKAEVDMTDYNNGCKIYVLTPNTFIVE